MAVGLGFARPHHCATNRCGVVPSAAEIRLFKMTVLARDLDHPFGGSIHRNGRPIDAEVIGTHLASNLTTAHWDWWLRYDLYWTLSAPRTPASRPLSASSARDRDGAAPFVFYQQTTWHSWERRRH